MSDQGDSPNNSSSNSSYGSAGAGPLALNTLQNNGVVDLEGLQRMAEATLTSGRISPGNLSPTEKCIYLQDLLRDRTQLEALPKSMFVRLSIVLDSEIDKVRRELFSSDSRILTRKHTSHDQNNNRSLALPAINPNTDRIMKRQKKVFMPVDKYPTFNFVGRIVGPRGRTIKEIEHKTGVKILVRGRGSMRNPAIEESKRGRPNYEHLHETLHVILQCEDSDDRARMRLDAAEHEIMRLINPEVEGGRDDIKKKQLTELAILNGTYNPCGPVKQPSPTSVPSFVTAQRPTVIQAAPQAYSTAGLILDPASNQLIQAGRYATPQIIYAAAPQTAPITTQASTAQAYEGFAAGTPIYFTNGLAAAGQSPAIAQYLTPGGATNGVHQQRVLSASQPIIASNAQPQAASGAGGKVQSVRLLQKTTITHSPY